MDTETNVIPCAAHRSILSSDLPWHRAVEIADDCDDCEVR